MSIEHTEANEYIPFEKGDRFSALLLGYAHIYRVKRVEMRTVKYEKEIKKEPIIVTKSGLVWTTHVCGALLDFDGKSADFVISPCVKTWISYKLKAGERATNPYAPGEK